MTGVALQSLPVCADFVNEVYQKTVKGLGDMEKALSSAQWYPGYGSLGN